MDLFVNSQESTRSSYDNTSNHINDDLKISFSASTTEILHLADIFSAVTTINTVALMIIRSSGIIIFSEYNHICNVQLTIDPSLFQIYNFYSNNSSQTDPEELRFGVDISLISEAFQSVVGASSIKKPKVESDNNNRIKDSVLCYMSFNHASGRFIVEFEDSLINEKIEFFTFYSDTIYPYDNFGSSSEEKNSELIVSHDEIQYELMMKSDVLYLLLQDLQKINTAELYLYVSNEYKVLGSKKHENILNGTNKGPKFVDNQLNFISRGPIGFLKLIYPNEKTILEKLLIFEKDDSSNINEVHTSLISSFNFSIFIRTFKAVKLSSKCKMLKDFRGVLSIQLLCKNSNSSYSGTLIKFNMLESLTQTNEEVYLENNVGVYLNDIFDDDAYDYIKHYDKPFSNINTDGYTNLDESNSSRIDFADSVLHERNPNKKPEESKKGKEQGIDIPLFL